MGWLSNLFRSFSRRNTPVTYRAPSRPVTPPSSKPSVNDANYWNNKWQKANVSYAAPTSRNVLSYVTYQPIAQITQIANSLIQTNQLSARLPDAVPITVLRWLDSQFRAGKFKYKLDAVENWENPTQVLTSKVNDCDGWGIVEYFVIREIFMQLGIWQQVRHRLKCVAGNVNQYGAIPYSAGGHFYINWLHSDGYWYTIESTYHRAQAISRYGSTPQKFNKAYGTIWFSFNELYSWAQHSISVTQEDFRKFQRR